MTPLGQALSVALIQFVWQGLAVAAVLWIVLSALRNRSAQSRYLASCIALAALAAVPVITAWTVYARPMAIAAGFRGAVSRVALVAGGGVAQGSGSFEPWVLRVWALGVLVFSLRLVWSSRYVYKLQRTGAPAENDLIEGVARLVDRMGVSRAVSVLVSPLTDTPSVVGWLRPVILIPPACLIGLTAEQLETIIAHEIAHIIRHDYLVNVLQSVVEAVLFYHPAVWWISGRIRQERELCCDDMVVESCGDAVVYARALTGLERLRVGQQTLALGSTDGALSYRVRRLLGDAVTETQGLSRMAGILVLCLGIVCLTLPLSRAQPMRPRPGQASRQSPLKAPAWSTAIRSPIRRRYLATRGGDRQRGGCPRRRRKCKRRARAGRSMQPRAAVLASVLHWQFAPEGAGATGIVMILFPTRSMVQVKEANQQAIVRAFVSDEISSARAAWQAARQKNAQDGPDKALFDQAIRSIERGDYEGARLTLNTLIYTYDIRGAFLPEAKAGHRLQLGARGGHSRCSASRLSFRIFKSFMGAHPPSVELTFVRYP